MSGNITVVYEKGILRPLRPLNLPERTRLEIRIVESGESSKTDVERAYQALLQAGLVQIQPSISVEPVSDAERLQAADAYGEAGPVFDWLIAERGDT